MAAAKRNATVKAVETKAVKPAKIEAAEPAKALEQKAEEPVTLEKAEEASQDKTAPAPAKKRGRKPGSKNKVKAESPKAPAKKTTRATKTTKAVKKEAEVKEEAAVKEDAVKAPAKRVGRKPKVEAEISVQFAGKSYGREDLIKIAKDVWKYDLKKEERDLKEIKLYVKPEESLVYYVFNGEEEGSFII